MTARTTAAATLLAAVLSVVSHSPALQAQEAAPAPPQPTYVRSSNAADEPLDELDIRDVPLRDALSLIGLATDLNLAASDEASKAKVSLRLRNVAPYAAVETLCQTHGLFFKRPTKEGGVGIVTTLKEFQQGLTVFREEKTAIFTLLYPNALDLAVAVHDLFGDRVRVSLGKDEVFDEKDDIQRRFDKFDLLDQRSQGLGNSFSSTGSGSGGSNSSSTSGRSSGGTSGGGRGGLQLNQTPGRDTELSADEINKGPRELRNLTTEQMARIADLVREQGVGVGVDADRLEGIRQNATPIYVSVIGRNNQVIVRTSDPGVLEEIAKLKAAIDIPTPQVLLEVKVLSIDLSDGFRSVFDYQFGDANNSASFSGGVIAQAPGGAAPDVTVGGTGVDRTSLIYQWVNDNFRFRMQLLDNRNRVTTLATPLLLVANNEVSRVFVGEERPIVRNISSQTTATQGVVTSTPVTTFEFRPVGTTLLITPNINADRTVTLRLIQEKSDIITGGASIPVVTSNGSVTQQPLDVVSARTLTGTVIAKDGLSLALGGLIEEGVQDAREEVPVLGRLPVVGILFRRQATTRFRREVVIVIRPYILSTPSEAEATGKRLADALTIHPKGPELNPEPGEPIGSMKTYLPHEVLRPNPPKNDLEKTFRFHSVLPDEF